MTPDEMKLAELLCARLCHDLAGPVGAVATGAELLGDEGDLVEGLGAEALALLESSAAAAAARLRFLRTALGSAGGTLGAAALRDLAAAFFGQPAGASETVELVWRDASSAPWEAEPAKLLLNLLLLARDCLPRGGRIEVSARQPEGTSVTALGKGALAGESATALKSASPEGLGPRGAQGYYAGKVAERCGGVIIVTGGPDQVEFRVG